MTNVFVFFRFQGATVKNEGDSVIIARIVKGGAAEKSGKFVFFFFFSFQLCCSQVISPMRNLVCFPWGKPEATEASYSTYSACWVF